MFNFRGGENGSPGDLDWGEVVNYGTGSEVDQFLQNDEEAQGYERSQFRTGMGAFGIFAEWQILRDRKVKSAKIYPIRNETYGGV